jgi:hypothetical protein
MLSPGQTPAEPDQLDDMARKRKTGFDYFPFPAIDSPEMDALFTEYHHRGLVIWVKTMQEIYRSENGWLDFSLASQQKQAERCRVPLTEWQVIIAYCVDELGLFSPTLAAQGRLSRPDILEEFTRLHREREAARQRAERQAGRAGQGLAGAGRAPEPDASQEFYGVEFPAPNPAPPEPASPEFYAVESGRPLEPANSSCFSYPPEFYGVESGQQYGNGFPPSPSPLHPPTPTPLPQLGVIPAIEDLNTKHPAYARLASDQQPDQDGDEPAGPQEAPGSPRKPQAPPVAGGTPERATTGQPEPPAAKSSRAGQKHSSRAEFEAAKAAVKLPPVLDTEEFRGYWLGWLEARFQRHKRPVNWETYLVKQLALLKAESYPVALCMAERSWRNEWMGICHRPLRSVFNGWLESRTEPLTDGLGQTFPLSGDYLNTKHNQQHGANRPNGRHQPGRKPDFQ